jgi:hypothetical protein
MRDRRSAAAQRMAAEPRWRNVITQWEMHPRKSRNANKRKLRSCAKKKASLV